MQLNKRVNYYMCWNVIFRSFLQKTKNQQIK